MIDLYVYYKVRIEDAARLEPLVRSLQARVGPGGARLMRRPGSRDGLQTWMEVYPDVPESFAAGLEAAALDAGLDALIAGPRRAEVFVELTPCA
ncbi:MAG: hypothetical protein JWP72_164 [Massilia sp.]|jgi:hypothetical protein|nr:hypothetical protein [Massilia sp.]MDB5791128.1 hypothetical protein [Massilia sp.]